MKSHLDECPTCGSQKIRPMKKTLEFTHHGRKVSVPQVHCDVCPDCGEIVTDYEANQYIDAVLFGQEHKRAS